MKKFFILVKKNWDYLLLFLIILIYIITLSNLSILRHNAFASGFDLANMDQTLWNTINGNIFSLTGDSGNISRFSIHSDIILALISPIYFIWNDVRILEIFESIIIALGAIPVFLLSKKILKNKFISLIFATIFLLNPNMQWTNIYDFHPVSLSITFLLFSFYFAYIKKWNYYSIFILLSILCKEEVSLTIALLGIFIFTFFKEKKLGIITFITGVLWFFVFVFLIMPHYSTQGKHWALSWYQFSENQNQKLIEIPSLKVLIQKMTAEDAKKYYLDLLKPFSYVAIFGIPYIFLAVPELMVNLLSSHGQMRSISFHYDSVINPWLIISTIYFIYYLNIFFKKNKYFKKNANNIITIISIGLLFVAVRINYHYSPLPTTPSCWKNIYTPTKADIDFENELKKIPENTTITASPEIRPHLTHRKIAYTLPVATESADFIAIIDQNRMVGDYNPKDYELKLIKILDEQKKYTLIKHTDHLFLYKKK